MIVLLHAYNMGFTAMEVAIMFSMYELAGVFTNLLAGMAGGWAELEGRAAPQVGACQQAGGWCLRA